MPHYLRSIANDNHELVLVQYSDSPQYEVRLYAYELPHDHRTLIVTDSVADAERIYQQHAAHL